MTNKETAFYFMVLGLFSGGTIGFIVGLIWNN